MQHRAFVNTYFVFVFSPILRFVENRNIGLSALFFWWENYCPLTKLNFTETMVEKQF